MIRSLSIVFLPIGFLLASLAVTGAAAQTPPAEKPAMEKPAEAKLVDAVSPEKTGGAGEKTGSAAAADIPPLPVMHEGRQMEDMGTVVLRTIDKLSARAHTFDIPVDKTVKFGNSLFIKARACRRSSPLDQPESAAFLQIWERKPAEQTSHWIFSGWMFGSNPSLSYMDHPVYDVWVIECKNAVTSAKAEAFSSEKIPEHAPAKDLAAATAAVSGKPAADASTADKPVADSVKKPDAGTVDDKPVAESKPAAAVKPAATVKPAESTPLTPEQSREAAERALTEQSFDEADKPAPKSGATPAATPATAPADTAATPAGEVPPVDKPAPVPAIDKLPGSFEDGEDSKNLPED